MYVLTFCYIFALEVDPVFNFLIFLSIVAHFKQLNRNQNASQEEEVWETV